MPREDNEKIKWQPKKYLNIHFLEFSKYYAVLYVFT